MNSTRIADRQKSCLTKIVPLAQTLLAESIHRGDLAIDLTAGNGRDTLFLYRCVGPAGTVISFDVQHDALVNTAQMLAAENIPCSRHTSPPQAWTEGVHLVHTGHERLDEFIRQTPKAVVANLGYLPGGDKRLVTTSESTIRALSLAAALLGRGGRIAVVAYPGHPGGSEEAGEVDRWFSARDDKIWDVLRLSVANRPESPLLLVAEKKG